MSLTEIANLHGPSIVTALEAVDKREINLPGKKGGKKTSTEFKLRVPINLISKEIKKFRACDTDNCVYCREWISYVFKKEYYLNINDLVFHKSEQSCFTGSNKHIDACLNYIKLLKEDAKNNSSKNQSYSFLHKSYGHLILKLAEATTNVVECFTNAKLIAEFFRQLESSFDKLPVPGISEDVEDNCTIFLPYLDFLEKGHMSLNESSFTSLKYISPALQISISTPDCDHSVENCKTPDEVKRDVLESNRNFVKSVPECTNVWQHNAVEAWRVVNDYLEGLNRLDSLRNQFLKTQKISIFDFHTKYETKVKLPFLDLTNGISDKKNGKKPVSKSKHGNSISESEFAEYIDHINSTLSNFEAIKNETLKFIVEFKNDMNEMSQRLLYLSKSRAYIYSEYNELPFIIKRFNDDTGRTESAKKFLHGLDSLFNLDYLKSNSLLKFKVKDILIANEEASKQHDIISANLTFLFRSKKSQFDSSIIELEGFKKDIADQWRKARVAATENLLLQTKEYRARIENFEAKYRSYREMVLAFFEKLFPMKDFVLSVSCTVEALVLEALFMQTNYFFESYFTVYEPTLTERDNQHANAEMIFAEGIKTGRRMLGGIVGKFLLRDGLRILEENKAMSKQKQLLDEWDLDEPKNEKESLNLENSETKGKKKNKKKKKKQVDETLEDVNEPSALVEDQTSTPLSPEDTPILAKQSLKPSTSEVAADTLNSPIDSSLHRKSNGIKPSENSFIHTPQSISNRTSPLNEGKDSYLNSSLKTSTGHLVPSYSSAYNELGIENLNSVPTDVPEPIATFESKTNENSKPNDPLANAFNKIKQLVHEQLSSIELNVFGNDSSLYELDEDGIPTLNKKKIAIERVGNDVLIKLVKSMYKERGLDHMILQTLESEIDNVITLYNKTKLSSNLHEEAISSQIEFMNRMHHQLVKRTAQVIALLRQQATLCEMLTGIPALKDVFDAPASLQSYNQQLDEVSKEINDFYSDSNYPVLFPQANNSNLDADNLDATQPRGSVPTATNKLTKETKSKHAK